MTTRQRARRIGLLLITLVMVASACTASETVTINEAAVTSATSTALRNSAGRNGGDSDDDTSSPQQANDETTADETAANPAPVAGQECTFDRIDTFDDIQVELSFTSPLRETEDASLTYEVFDGNGEFLESSSTKLEEVAPGEQIRMAVDTLIDAPVNSAARTGITCEIVDIESIPFGLDDFDPSPTDSCVFLELDSFDDVQVEITVTSPLSNVAGLIIDYALRGPDGVRFDDGIAFVDEDVSPGESITTPTDTFTEFPSWVTESSFSCDILSIQEF